MEIKYFIEQVNVSDDQYKIVEINYENGDFVSKDSVMFCYESSKTIFEALAKEDGFLYLNPSCKIDEDYDVGYHIAIQTSEEVNISDLRELFKEESIEKKQNNKDIKVSKKAQILINKYSISLSEFKEHEIISEKVVVDYLETFVNPINNLETFAAKNSEVEFFASELKTSRDNKIKLAVIGAGKAALQLYDSLIDSDDYEIVRFYDSNKSKKQKELFGIKIQYGDIAKNMIQDFQSNIFEECIISFSGNIEARKLLFDNLINKKFKFANIIHKTAYISKLCKIGVGNIIFANVRLGPFCSIGDNNVISASCSIEHNNLIGSHNTFGPNVFFSGSCTIADQNKFGTMIGIEPNVVIGSNNVIASSQVVNTLIGDNKLLRPKISYELKDR